MEKMAVIKGLGPNEIEIIGMVFSNFQNAFDYAKNVLGEPTMQGTTKGHRAAFWDTYRIFEDDPSLAENFFTDYYGGCGECGNIEVIEVDAGVPLAAFNLD